MPEWIHKLQSLPRMHGKERKRWLAPIKILTNSAVAPTMLIKLQQVKSPKDKFGLICERFGCNQELDLRGLLEEIKGF